MSSSCYLTPSLTCYQSVMVSNSLGSWFVVIIQNNLGVGLSFPANSIYFSPYFPSNSTYVGASYVGTCLPQSAPKGATFICNVTMSGAHASVGSQITGAFTISYKICSPTCSSQVYNTTGSAVTVASAAKLVFSKITLFTAPTNGFIAIGGVSYPSGANVVFISGISYPIFAVLPQGYTHFLGWTSSANLTLSSNALQSSAANAVGPGNLIATFTP